MSVPVPGRAHLELAYNRAMALGVGTTVAAVTAAGPGLADLWP
jgi:hypothetical protein